MALPVTKLSDVSLERWLPPSPSLEKAHSAPLCGEGTGHHSFQGPFDFLNGQSIVSRF